MMMKKKLFYTMADNRLFLPFVSLDEDDNATGDTVLMHLLALDLDNNSIKESFMKLHISEMPTFHRTPKKWLEDHMGMFLGHKADFVSAVMCSSEDAEVLISKPDYCAHYFKTYFTLPRDPEYKIEIIERHQAYQMCEDGLECWKLVSNTIWSK